MIAGIISAFSTRKLYLFFWISYLKKLQGLQKYINQYEFIYSSGVQASNSAILLKKPHFVLVKYLKMRTDMQTHSFIVNFAFNFIANAEWMKVWIYLSYFLTRSVHKFISFCWMQSKHNYERKTCEQEYCHPKKLFYWFELIENLTHQYKMVLRPDSKRFLKFFPNSQAYKSLTKTL